MNSICQHFAAYGDLSAQSGSPSTSLTSRVSGESLFGDYDEVQHSSNAGADTRIQRDWDLSLG